MNIYEQLLEVRANLQEHGVGPRTIEVIDTMLTRAKGERDSAVSVSRLQVLRHVMRMPDVLNDEDVRLDLIGLEGDLEEAAAAKSQPVAELEQDLHRPKLKKYYKKKT
ncbi:MAG: hypothetical protein ACRDFS_04555 [Chloroflexota bacterium]